MQLALAPLQTYTDFHFRNAHFTVFGGVDKFYAPYLKMNNDGSIKEGPKKDILPKHNSLFPIIPQLMACNSSDFLIMARYIEELGYKEVNWNLGCPYPMVTNRDLGAGLLNKPQSIVNILEEVIPQTNLKIGIKMRMGMEDTTDILSILPLLNNFDLTEIIIHARYAKQLYNGTCDHEQFLNCLELTNHSITYNGDITDSDEFRELRTKFAGIDSFMIGRGAMINPALFEEIKTATIDNSEDYRRKLQLFTKRLEESLLGFNDSPGYALGKLQSYWEYLCDGLSDGKQLYRKLKKAKTHQDFMNILEEDLI
jgi:tRNA-dihydrouridine synthase